MKLNPIFLTEGNIAETVSQFKQIAKSLEEIYKQFDIPLGQIEFLQAFPRDGSITAKRLSTQMHVSRQATYQMIRLLSEKDYIAITTYGRNGARLMYALTPFGRNLLDQIYEQEIEIFAQAWRAANQEDVNGFRNVLNHLLVFPQKIAN